MKRPWKKWTQKDVVVMRRDYGRRSTLELAKELGRSANSLSNKAHELGITHRYKRKAVPQKPVALPDIASASEPVEQSANIHAALFISAALLVIAIIAGLS